MAPEPSNLSTAPRPATPATAPQPSGSQVAVEMPKAYKPIDHEDRIRARWDGAKAFNADPTRVTSGEARPYSIVIPPPNVTAALHLGHALNNTLQDVLVRAHRMMGYETLWMPGTDHAGIATQAVVEKRLRKEGKLKGSLRQNYSRDQFVADTQAFKDEYEAVITDQLKRMGCSCDWDRQRFTMDDVCARAVREAFFRLFRDGLIYRGKRLVNWDPALQTAVADDECEDEEIDSFFYYLRYPLVHEDRQKSSEASRHRAEDAQPVTWNELAARGFPGADQHPPEEAAWVTVATTRPETYLGDTAVAVNPHDPRAKALRGLFVELPLVGRVIPILEDSYVVLPKAMARSEEEANDPKAEFATGFLKVTPAHDPNDYEIGRRHSVDGAMQEWSQARGRAVMVNMFAPDGTVSDRHGWSDVGDAKMLVGLKREDARKKVVEEFKARGLLEATRPYRHSVKISDRSKAIIEPYLSDQWYVKVTDPRLAESANRALAGRHQGTEASRHQGTADGDGALQFHPDRYARTYEQWHDGIRDWCISRQLWWGHRIPVWTSLNAGEAAKAWLRTNKDNIAVTQIDHTTFACVRAADETIEKRLQELGFSQDPDVLDTWFSSALWPMSTMGWPDPAQAAKDTGIPDMKDMLAAFNPTTTLCTAREIITLWVSRMVMFNRYLMGAGQGKGPVPFRNVFIHAVIQDGEGRKMSKSLGNGVDPLDIIATHGADAMRFTLCQMATNTQDVRLPVVKDSATGKNTSPKFDLGRNFCNKLWNAARFAVGILTAAPAAASRGGSAAPVSAKSLSLIDRWMLSRLQAATAEINSAVEHFEFSLYAQSIYTLLWNDFCDWYLEAIKPTVAEDANQRAVLRSVLDAILRILHPVAPFVTEAAYETVGTLPAAPVAGLRLDAPRKPGLLATAGWPVIDQSLRDEAAEREFSQLQGLITAIREVRAQHKVAPKRKIVLHVPAHVAGHWRPHAVTLATLAGLETQTTDAPSGSNVVFTFEAREYAVSNLADAAAVDSGAERARLEKIIADSEKLIAVLEGRLANPGYAQKAPPHMVQQTKDQLAKAIAERSAAAESLKKLGS
ncbi:MAG: valine--tRNA ligase [Phycisphaerales bacterium]|nr:valine--tRNA ligase [Phycisphaerales bacterium]